MCRFRALTEKPTKIYELFWLTVGARLPSATNSITLRAGRYRFIPALQAILLFEKKLKNTAFSLSESSSRVSNFIQK